MSNLTKTDLFGDYVIIRVYIDKIIRYRERPDHGLLFELSLYIFTCSSQIWHENKQTKLLGYIVKIIIDQEHPHHGLTFKTAKKYIYLLLVKYDSQKAHWVTISNLLQRDVGGLHLGLGSSSSSSGSSQRSGVAKSMRLWTTWVPTRTWRPNALRSTTNSIRGGWR